MYKFTAIHFYCLEIFWSIWSIIVWISIFFFLIHLGGSSIVFGVILEFDLDPAKVPESEPLFKICTVQSFY